MTSPIVIDLILLAILLFFMVTGAKRGFVLAFCSLVAVIVALVGANLVADALAPKVADTIQPRLERTIQDTLKIKAEESDLFGVDDLPISDILVSLKEKGGIYEIAANNLEQAGWTIKEFIYSNNDGISRTASTVAAAVAAQLAHGLLFLVAFFLVLFAWTVLSHALDLVAKLPGLNSLNGLLGGVVGLLKGLIIAYIAVWVLYTLTGTVSQETAQQTRLFLFLAQHGPLELLMAGQTLLGE